MCDPPPSSLGILRAPSLRRRGRPATSIRLAVLLRVLYETLNRLRTSYSTVPAPGVCSRARMKYGRVGSRAEHEACGCMQECVVPRGQRLPAAARDGGSRDGTGGESGVRRRQFARRIAAKFENFLFPISTPSPDSSQYHSTGRSSHESIQFKSSQLDLTCMGASL